MRPCPPESRVTERRPNPNSNPNPSPKPNPSPHPYPQPNPTLSHRKAVKPAGFGATNDAPPELTVKGRFGRLAAEATARGDHGARAKEITKQRVLESYAAAKAQRKMPVGGGHSKG